MRVACVACAKPDVVSWRVAHEVISGQPSPRSWTLQRCSACGTAFLPDLGQSLADRELYETGVYGPSAGRGGRWLSLLHQLRDRERVRLLGALPHSARVIEVGAGRGRLVRALRARGYDAVGIEPSRASSGAAIVQGLPVEAVDLESASFPPAEADLVVLWHVLEHLDDPGEALRRGRAWLKEGGRLVLAVPNLGSVQARIGGDRWFHQDVPRHRIQFTMDGLVALLRRLDFAPERARHLMIEQNWLGMWLTLLNRLTVGRDVPYRYLKRDLRYPIRGSAARDGVVSVLAGIPLIPVAAALETGAGLARRGGTVLVHARPA